MLAKLKMTESDDINEKIAKEERKLLKVQRKLEAIRLIEELFRRIKVTLSLLAIITKLTYYIIDQK